MFVFVWFVFVLVVLVFTLPEILLRLAVPNTRASGASLPAGEAEPTGSFATGAAAAGFSTSAPHSGQRRSSISMVYPHSGQNFVLLIAFYLFYGYHSTYPLPPSHAFTVAPHSLQNLSPGTNSAPHSAHFGMLTPFDAEGSACDAGFAVACRTICCGCSTGRTLLRVV